MNTLAKRPFLFGALLVVGIIAGMLIVNYSGMDTVGDANETESELNAEEGTSVRGAGEISVSSQPAGRAVVVAEAVLPQEGWVVVHEARGGELGNALGAARRGAGQHTGIVVELLRGTEPGMNYFVTLYADNGNGTFELKEDMLVGDENGQIIRGSFTATTPLSPAGN